MALRRPLALAVVVAGLAGGFALGAAAGDHTSTASAGPCPLSTGTITCCPPPKQPATECPTPCTTTCTAPEPTVPTPAPVATLQLSIPSNGFVVRRGHFRVTCRLNGGTGRCSVTARRSGKTVGSGHRSFSDGRARVTVRLGSAARATLARRRHMRVGLVARADGKRTSATATLRAG